MNISTNSTAVTRIGPDLGLVKTSTTLCRARVRPDAGSARPAHCDTATSATGCGGGGRASPSGERRGRGLRLQQADRRHDGSLEHHRRDRRDADGVDGGHEGLDHQRAHERAGEGVAAAVEGGAAEDDGEDRVQLDEQAGVVGVGSGLVGGEDQAGDRRQHGAEGVDGEQQAPGPDAGLAAGLGVDADALDQQAQRRPAGEQGSEDDDHRAGDRSRPGCRARSRSRGT